MSVRILIGDVRARLRELPDESVHSVVTSPPYFGLRDYGIDGQIGLEASPEAYVEVLVETFREVRRVLRPDGTVWLNLGDSYASGGRDSQDPGKSKLHPAFNGEAYKRGLRPKDGPGIKPKDLLGIPWHVAFALRADGWYLRSEIVWHKPNPMPESVTDRPTSAHEKLFLLSKSPRYFYDADAVREPLLTAECENYPARSKILGRGLQPGSAAYLGSAQRNNSGGFAPNGNGRNLRNVWTIATAPFPEAHFATFPPALVEPCIKAGTSEKGCCPKCGAPWGRNVERPKAPEGLRNRGAGAKMDFHSRQTGSGQKLQDWYDANPAKTTGWSLACNCPDVAPVPCTVFDPFGGAGTVGLVADRLGRDAILIEINPEYAEMAKRRITDDARMFGVVEIIQGV